MIIIIMIIIIILRLRPCRRPPVSYSLHVVNSWMCSIRELDFHQFGALKSSKNDAGALLEGIWVGAGGAGAGIYSFPRAWGLPWGTPDPATLPRGW